VQGEGRARVIEAWLPLIDEDTMNTHRRRSKLPARVAVIGAARSGIAAARYLHENGVMVFISDSCPAEKLDMVLASNKLAHLSHEAGGHSERVLESEAIVLSPGVPSDLPVLKQARKRRIPIWSELELGFRRSAADWLAITGSSGKSTTTSMLGAIMQSSARPTVVCGNIGVPVVAVAPQLVGEGVVVAEVSSFQLENFDRFKPVVAAVLNLMRNHLDRYASEEDYYQAKMAIARNLDMGCHLVVNAGDERLHTWARTLTQRTNVSYFGRAEAGAMSVWPQDDALVAGRGAAERRLLGLEDLQVAGRHNGENAAAAAAIALAAGASDAAVAAGLKSFAGLPHRLQFAGEFGGVRWYNDSKSTTAESVRVAVTAFPGNVHLIAGGRDKGCDFTVVNDVLAAQVKQVILIGEAAERIESIWRGMVPIVRARSLDAAIHAAASGARGGDVVVLSPGCSSFDMFHDYEERGEVFMRRVRELAPRLARGAK
jgi:UDP-N-acetylmuramoylalanine--D-glutamate ligase